MKILAIHNFHRTGSASGDDQVFKSETGLLEKHGNEVIRYSVSNDSFDSTGIFGKLAAAFGMFWSTKYYKEVSDIITMEKPDVVHVHTFFPLLSPSILYAAKKSGCKVVATLHDTRFICPCATSLRGSTLCNKCTDGRYFRMFKHRCFKGSRVQSLIVAMIFKIHRKLKSFDNKIDTYICLNDNQMNLLVEGGFDRKKMIKKYNFVPDTKVKESDPSCNNLPEKYVVFYGRIGEEKGIKQLEKIWGKIDDIPLVVMGGGPLEEEFSEWAKSKSNVYFLGYTPHDECLAIVKKAKFVVFTSIWYEGCSMVEIETESLGKPLVANDLGFSSEAIVDGYNGYKVPVGEIDEFVSKVYQLWENEDICFDMGKNARKDYEQKYQPEENYRQLMNIYCGLGEE